MRPQIYLIVVYTSWNMCEEPQSLQIIVVYVLLLLGYDTIMNHDYAIYILSVMSVESHVSRLTTIK